VIGPRLLLKPKNALLCSQQPSTRHYHKPNYSSPHPHILFKNRLHSPKLNTY
jgi:hypothetical protein